MSSIMDEHKSGSSDIIMKLQDTRDPSNSKKKKEKRTLPKSKQPKSFQIS